MSWSGPITGAAPYQPPPYANGVHGQAPCGHQQNPQYGQQTGYNQYQTGFTYPQPGAPLQPPESRPPKKKGNPIITRYPPPPGYRGPAQSQGSFGTVQYQTPQQGFAQGPPAPGPAPYPNQPYQGPSPTQGYSPHSYGPPQSYPPQQAYSQPGYQPTQSYQWPQQPPQSYPSQPPVAPPQYPTTQGYPQQQTGYQQFPTQPIPINTNRQAWSNTQSWQQLPGSATYPPANPYSSFDDNPHNSQRISDPNATPNPSSTNPTISQPTPTNTQPTSAASETASGEKPPLFLGWDDWDFDFEGAIWPKANELVDPNLSLGVITWRPSKQVTRALPATFGEAEEQSLKPPAEKLGNGESVSLYFTFENSYEAFLDVRRTDEWYNIKDDPAFVVFTDEEMARNLVSIEDCLALRDRPDESVEEKAEKGDEEMPDPTWNVMDNLEQALSGDMEDVKRPTPPHPAVNSSRGETQEDVLARLGVTGSPKPPSGEPPSFPFPQQSQLPASLPSKPPAPPSSNVPSRPEIPPQRAQSYSALRSSTHGPAIPRPYGSMSSTTSHKSPPAPPCNGRTDPWNSNASTQPQPPGNVHMHIGPRQSPTRSEGSNATAAGSDFGTEKAANDFEHDSTPIPQLKQSDSSFARKRSYEETKQEDGQARQLDDHTKRKRRTQVDAAYSRR